MAVDEAKLNEFLGKAVGDLGAAMSATLILVGDRLGLYRELAKGAGDFGRPGAAHRHRRALRSRMAGQPGRRRLCRVRLRARRVVAESGAGAVPDRPERPRRHAGCLQHRRGDVPRARAHARQLQIRGRDGVGRAPSLPVRGNRAILPRRLQHQPDRLVAARAGRRRRQAAARSQGGRCRVRPRREHHSDGADVSGFGVRRLRLSRRIDQGRNRKGGGSRCRQRAIRGRRCGRLQRQGAST